MFAEVKMHNGVPTLFINGAPTYAQAYISYLEERARYKDFAEAGIHLYTFPVYTAGRGINTNSGIGPFRRGVWDLPDTLDFSMIDAELEQILTADPKAYIFPRLCLDMPEWWEMKYPDELSVLSNGEIRRQSFCSQKWKEDARWILKNVIEYIDKSKFKPHVIGYHISAGSTEEWFYHGAPYADYGPAAKEAYREYVAEKYGCSGHTAAQSRQDGNTAYAFIEVPDFHEGNGGDSVLLDPAVARNIVDYRQFLSCAVTDAIIEFTRYVKQLLDSRLIVGVFYGYATELTDPRFGHHNSQQLVREKSIDFFCSPNSYMFSRPGGCDWAYMTLADTIKLHGKLYWSECDTRTFLTRPLREARPEIVPEGTYEGGVWEGPDSLALSMSFLTKNFGKNITSGAGQWWFDMWGGWFAHPRMMELFRRFAEVGEASLWLEGRQSASEIAVIIDEKAYAYMKPESGIAHELVYVQRRALGELGTPYDIYEASDVELLCEKQYKLFLFLNTCCFSDGLLQAVKKLSTNGRTLLWVYGPGIVNDSISAESASVLTGMKLELIPERLTGRVHITKEYLGTLALSAPAVDTFGVPMQIRPMLKVADPKALPLGYLEGTAYCGFAFKQEHDHRILFSAVPGLPGHVLRGVAKTSGVHIYVDSDDIVYANTHFICIHAKSAGVKNISLPFFAVVIDVLEGYKILATGKSFCIELEQYETRLFRVVKV